MPKTIKPRMGLMGMMLKESLSYGIGLIIIFFVSLLFALFLPGSFTSFKWTGVVDMEGYGAVFTFGCLFIGIGLFYCYVVTRIFKTKRENADAESVIKEREETRKMDKQLGKKNMKRPKKKKEDDDLGLVGDAEKGAVMPKMSQKEKMDLIYHYLYERTFGNKGYIGHREYYPIWLSTDELVNYVNQPEKEVEDLCSKDERIVYGSYKDKGCEKDDKKYWALRINIDNHYFWETHRKEQENKKKKKN